MPSVLAAPLSILYGLHHKGFLQISAQFSLFVRIT
jgi:hypothetical protein